MNYFDAEHIFSRIVEMKALQQGVADFFRYHSEFWKAFEEYLCKCAIGYCPFFNKDGDVYHTHAHSGIHWLDCYADPAGAWPNTDIIRIHFRVDWWDDEREFKHSNNGMIDVPKNIITHFTTEVFTAWIEENEKRYLEKRKEEAKKALSLLYTKYPELRTENL